MKNIFLDVNIVIDYLMRRNVGETNTYELFSNRDINLFISSLTTHIIVYTLKIKRGTQEFAKFKRLIEGLNIIPVNQSMVVRALDTDYKDFEDLLQFYCATTVCDTILTRDIKDFKKIKEITKNKVAIISRYP